jgi:transcription termination factor NusB
MTRHDPPPARLRPPVAHRPPSTGARKAASKSAAQPLARIRAAGAVPAPGGRNEAAPSTPSRATWPGFHKATPRTTTRCCTAAWRAAELDALIVPLLDRKLEEISPIEHAVMWIGAYEFCHCLDVPWRVVLNECIELAKEFGGTDGHKYVNAVLNGLAPSLRAAEVAADRAASAPRMKDPRMKISARAQRIEPFYVMEVAKAAAALAREVAARRAPMIFLNIGEPDFTAPPLVQEAAARAIRDGRTQYTQATGLEPCASASAPGMPSRFGVQVPARRIVVTAGASAALQLACLALIEAGDEILMPDPSYPCNRQFVSAAEGNAVLTSPPPRRALPAQRRPRWRRPGNPAHARRAAGLALQPHRHLDPPGRVARASTRW